MLKSAANKPIIILGLFSLFSYVFVINGWVVDDAYITFRTVDNFLNGNGLTWNVFERVQTYTHPMWFFVLSLCQYLISDFYFSAIIPSYLFVLAAMGLAGYGLYRKDKNLTSAALLTILLLGCKAFVDYSSSGLENPLSYWLASLFLYFLLLHPSDTSTFSLRRISVFFLIASLAFFNRQDTILLYIPLLLYLLFLNIRQRPVTLPLIVFLSILPATVWFVFSFFYYGSPFPNTAYAKSFSSGLDLSYKINAGLQYGFSSLSQDPINHALIFGSFAWTLIRKDKPAVFMMLGVLLYYTYIITTAAAATHMGGRFFSVPFFISTLIFVYYCQHNIARLLTVVILVVVAMINPVSPFKTGTSWYHAPLQVAGPSHIDTKYYVQREGGALLEQFGKQNITHHPWYQNGSEFKQQPETVHIGGAYGGDAVGYFSFSAGSKKRIIDLAGLTDPLLARLPACIDYSKRVKSGHYRRSMPDGYAETIATLSNQITDESLREYYRILANVTRGPLFDVERIKQLLALTTGQYDHLIEAYVAHQTEKHGSYCSPPVGPLMVGPFTIQAAADIQTTTSIQIKTKDD